MTEPIYIDSDNALGSTPGKGRARGGIDDGFAIAALLKSELSTCAIGSVFGNVDEQEAFRNNRVLGRLCGFEGPFLSGSKEARPRRTVASKFLAEFDGPLRILALGPLTNIASALRWSTRFQDHVSELIWVGNNTRSIGRWPPFWPHEFNLTSDQESTLLVFESDLPITIVPLDVAKNLKLDRERAFSLEGKVGKYLKESALEHLKKVWFFNRSVPLYDLVASLYVIDPKIFHVEETKARLHKNTRIELGKGHRQIKVVNGFDPKVLWDFFLNILGGLPESLTDEKDLPQAKRPDAGIEVPNPSRYDH